MTKTEMEKFFAIELRDYVKTIISIHLWFWYTGHE